ncbi:hypothetical protein BC936DRAFT_148938 [Jimgerdemannia flammicorona]|uniref:Uncharacterized protein n=1 Tax=Jimgerdemannia flammicorona TaxID=994334 RepID=A0A433DK76_9FUNG|nr:hypothetical protein BC936DRAFT_148938 [Jimgerdemannia flammicorona]
MPPSPSHPPDHIRPTADAERFSSYIPNVSLGPLISPSPILHTTSHTSRKAYMKVRGRVQEVIHCPRTTLLTTTSAPVAKRSGTPSGKLYTRPRLPPSQTRTGFCVYRFGRHRHFLTLVFINVYESPDALLNVHAPRISTSPKSGQGSMPLASPAQHSIRMMDSMHLQKTLRGPSDVSGYSYVNSLSEVNFGLIKPDPLLGESAPVG